MAGVTFGGLATGLDTESIITQLMELERQPLDRLEAQKTTEENKLQAFSQLNDRLTALKDSVREMTLTSQVRTGTVNVSDSAPFTATSSGATPGSYDVSVVQLAQVQKSVSDGYASQSDSVLGTGSLTIGGQTISITSENNSLIGLREAINQISEETGVTATIIDDGSEDAPYRLMLTGKDASTSFEPVFSLTDSEGAEVAVNMTETRSAQQAVAYIDGVKVVSGSNTIKDVISGVTLTLNGVSEMTYAGVEEVGVEPENWEFPPQYATSAMAIASDAEPLKEKLTAFVDSYNEVMDWISSGYPEFGASATTADDEEENLSYLVRGDSSVNGVKRQLQNLLTSVIDTSGPYKTLGQLGISTLQDGSLDLNDEKLNTALEENINGVASLLAGEGSTDGVMKKFNSTLLALTSYSTGLYAAKQDHYDDVVNRIDDNLLRLEPLIEKRQDTLQSQFNTLEQLVSSMNSQSNFLTQQMDMLTNMVTGNN